MAQTFAETVGTLDRVIGHVNNPDIAALSTAKGTES